MPWIQEPLLRTRATFIGSCGISVCSLHVVALSVKFLISNWTIWTRFCLKVTRTPDRGGTSGLVLSCNRGTIVRLRMYFGNLYTQYTHNTYIVQTQYRSSEQRAEQRAMTFYALHAPAKVHQRAFHSIRDSLHCTCHCTLLHRYVYTAYYILRGPGLHFRIIVKLTSQLLKCLGHTNSLLNALA